MLKLETLMPSAVRASRLRVTDTARVGEFSNKFFFEGLFYLGRGSILEGVLFLGYLKHVLSIETAVLAGIVVVVDTLVGTYIAHRKSTTILKD